MAFISRKKFFLFFTGVALSLCASAQVKIGNNPMTINANAILELESTNKGLLMPRVALSSTTLTTPLSAFVEGMTVYNTNTLNDVTPGIYYSDGTKWIKQGGEGTQLLKSVIIATDGQNTFTTPGTITNLLNIKVFRNGASVEFAKVGANQISLTLETANANCFAGDEIKIIQTL